MKITIVVGGRWHAFDLARELHRQGHLHRLITNYPRWFVTRWGIPAERVVSLPLTFWLVKAIYKMGGEALMMRCQWRVHRWFAHRAVRHLQGSELIHGWSSFSEPSLLWAKKHGIPTVLERSSAHILEQSRLLRTEHSRLGIQWAATHPKIEAMEASEYELCTKVAVPSLFVERSFLDRGYNKEKLFRNAFGVNLENFFPPQQPPQKPGHDNFNVIYAGAMSVQKGVHNLIDGFNLAQIRGAQLTLLGGATKELKASIRKHPTSIRFLGHRPQSELTSHYHKAHCFVMASIQEGMAMVQLQALACGLPLICTTNSGGEDLLRLTTGGGAALEHSNGVVEFEAGYLIETNRPDMIAWCLRNLAFNPELWTSKREAALQLASNTLSWESYGQRSIEHYKEIINRTQMHSTSKSEDQAPAR